MTNVLDHGFIVLEEWMGGEGAVLEAARICYQSESKGEEYDRKLIRRLLRASHNTVFEHAVFRFRVKCPIFVARHVMRHRISSYCEKSLRYCEAQPEYYTPLFAAEYDSRNYQEAMAAAWLAYKRWLDWGIPREQARGVLGTAFYTEFVWTINCWSLINFLNKRTAPAAQWETRQYAEAIVPLWEAVMPITAGAWMEMREC